MKKYRGFTLIELLVVIAIIGILSAVVLASLSTARNKGNDAAIQSDFSTIQTQAEIYYGGNGNSYGPTQAWATGAGSCTSGMFSNATIANALAGADNANGTGNVGCAATATTYVVASALQATTTAYWCVDNTGVAKYVSGAAFPAAAIAAG